MVLSELVIEPRVEVAPDVPRRRRHGAAIWHRASSESGLVFSLAAMLYLVCGAVLAFHYHSFFGDAVSRMANGFYVFYSRDPHLAAIGFVWNPLQSVADSVPLLLYHVWPPLATRDMAGTIVSSVSMAGAAFQLLAAFREWGVARLPRLVLVGLFALNPMVIYYGANGMSEALYLFTMVAVCRYLARWLRNDDSRSLTYAAVALGLCYLTRNEAVAPAVTAGALVFGVSFYRSAGLRHSRIMSGLTDLAVFLFPFVMGFVGWALVSYVITGSAFDQFTSEYGNSAQIAAGAGGGPVHVGPALRLEAEGLLYLAPLLVVIGVLASIAAVRRRDLLVLVPVTVVASALAFDLVAYVSGGIIWSYRYLIATLPLEVLLVGVVLASSPARTLKGAIRPRELSNAGARPRGLRGWDVRRVRPGVLTVVIIVLFGASIVTATAGMFNPRVGVEESRNLGFVVHGTGSKVDRGYADDFQRSQNIASAVSSLRLPDGDVIVDNSSPCVPLAIVLSPNPKVFVVPNDRDFQRILADPITFHAHYILVPPSNEGSLLATTRQYPELYDRGQDTAGQRFATLARSFAGSGGCPAFRLYRVTAETPVS